VSKGATWAIQRPGFLGTVRQLTDCAKCGELIRKSKSEPRHYANIGKPTLHCICDDCYDALPPTPPPEPHQ